MQVSYTFHISSKKYAITTTRKLSSASKHNLRKYSSRSNQTGHYDSDKIVQLAGTDNLFRDVEKVYHDQFDQALAEYNKNQKRTDRKILDYMRHISDNAKTDVAVEMIIQIGDKEFWEQVPEQRKYQMTYIYKDQLNALQQYIPEFVIANAVIHYDEDSPHIQVIGVPVSSGYKRGLSKQCSKTRVFTKASLEKLQDVLRERALVGMEKNPEIFRNVSLKPKEPGRNFDYSEEYYIRKKKGKLDEIEEELTGKRRALSEIEEKTKNAEEQLNYMTELTRREQETFAIVPFQKNDVFPVQGKTKKVLSIDSERRTVVMRDESRDTFFSREETFPLALAQKSFFEYMYSDIGLQRIRENMEKAESIRQERIEKRKALEEEKRKLEQEKKDLTRLKKDVEKLSDMKCPFHEGDRFEVNGEIMTVSFILEYSREVHFRTDSGRIKEMPLLDAVKAFSAFQKKQELTKEYSSLEQKIGDLKKEYEKTEQAFSEIKTVLNVFNHFPGVRDFVLELGHRIKCSIDRLNLEDVRDIFKEKVLGIKKQEPKHDQVQERSKGRSR